MALIARPYGRAYKSGSWLSFNTQTALIKLDHWEKITFEGSIDNYSKYMSRYVNTNKSQSLDGASRTIEGKIQREGSTIHWRQLVASEFYSYRYVTISDCD